MGNAVAANVREGGSPQAVSQGGKRFRTYYATVPLSASYATGGDTITNLPTDGGTLFAVEVLDGDANGGTYKVIWNKNTTTPKLIKLDEDGTSGVHAEDGATGDNSAISVRCRFIYEY